MGVRSPNFPSSAKILLFASQKDVKYETLHFFFSLPSKTFLKTTHFTWEKHILHKITREMEILLLNVFLFLKVSC